MRAMSDQRKLDTSLVCSPCLAEGRCRHLDFDLRCNWWTCNKHGAQITGEDVDTLTHLRTAKR